MDTVKIYWCEKLFKPKDIADSEFEGLDKKGFYMFWTGRYEGNGEYSGVKLQYIGKAFDRSLRTRIVEPHPAYAKIKKYLKDNPNSILRIQIGVIRECSLKRVSEDFFSDIEAALIYDNQPLANDKCKDSYTGRDIEITNEGDYAPLNASTVEYEE